MYEAGETLFLSKEVEEIVRLSQTHTEKDERRALIRSISIT